MKKSDTVNKELPPLTRSARLIVSQSIDVMLPGSLKCVARHFGQGDDRNYVV